MLGVLLTAGVGAVAFAAWLFFRDSTSNDMLSLDWFQAMLSRLQYSERRMLPSWWLSTGLLEAAHPAQSSGQSSWRESLGFWCVLTSNAMLLYLLVGYAGDKLYTACCSDLAGIASGRRRGRAGWLDRSLQLLTTWLPRGVRLLLVKDFRTFRRDVMQWSQFLIFFALLCFYFLNIQRLHYGQTISGWMMMISFLNLAVVGLLLATFTTRFIYPLVSLEGRRFWILGTLPIERGDILWGKFLFATGIAFLPCGGLILLSDLMLQLHHTAPLVIFMHQLSCLVLCVGLSGISVGLGARFPNLRETSPAKIAAGFGGTLTLVFSIVFVGAAVMATAVPTIHWVRLHRNAHLTMDAFRDGVWLGSGGAVAIGIVATLVIGAAATVIPLQSGIRAFRRLEP